MKRDNFISALEQICSVVGINIPEKPKQVNGVIPFSMEMLRSIDSELIDIKGIDKGTIVFRLYYPSNLELYVDDIHAEDPTVYLLKENMFQRYSDSLSVVLLTNLSVWIYYRISKYKTSFKEKGFEYYHFKRRNYNYLCGDRPIVNQLYCNIDSFMVFLNAPIEYLLVAKDETTLRRMQFQINEVRNEGKGEKPKKDKLILNYKFVTELYKLDDGTAQGIVKFRNEGIVVKFDTEKEAPLINDFNVLARQLKNLLSSFQSDNYNMLIHNISSQVVSAIYQQSEITEPELKMGCEKFKKNMSLKNIEIFPDGFMLIYDIKSDREEYLFVQLDSTYLIEEITIN